MSFPFIPNKKVEVPDINYEDKITLSSQKTALIIVDMQNDFVKEKGNLKVPAAKETVPKIKKLLQSARKSNVPVAYTQDTMREDDPEFDIWPEHCKENTWGWEIIPELKPKDNEVVCRKLRYDGFYGTWLEHYLSHIWKVENVVIVGTVSNICVLHTAGSAGLRWYKVVIPADGISALSEFDQALTLSQVSNLYSGIVLKSTEGITFKS
ncbi:MAG TPA: isochorismatase family cysteine hydrolase [Acidobacteriota bacterium]|nr:isochorismatase family cysteine hydrolase [Acidobacteriota bacterium]